jgi:putative endonuclease
MAAFLYILYSEKLDKFYIGSTSDIVRRISEHNRGKEKFTKTGMPWELKYKEEFSELIDARRRELFIKKQKSRKFIENLIKSVG